MYLVDPCLIAIFLPDSLLCIGEGVCWDVKKNSHVWRVCTLFSGEEGIFFLGHDVAGVSIRGMVIVFDALGASDELGAWCQRLLKLGRPCILSIVPMAVLMFSALYFTMLVICMVSVWFDR